MDYNPQLSTPLRLLPGKTDRKNLNQWLPAWVHMRDTASIMRHLCRHWLPDVAKRVFPAEWNQPVQGRTTLEKVCVLLAQVHDIGKLTPVFTSRLLRSLPEISEKLNGAGFALSPGDVFLNGKESPHALAGQAILLNADCPDWTAAIVGAHHGKPLSAKAYAEIRRQMEFYPQNYHGAKGGRDGVDAPLWENVRREWLSVSIQESGLSSLKDIPAPELPAQMVLTGLLIMADWIASNSRYFPLISLDQDGTGLDFSRRAETAWEKLALTEPWHPGTFAMDAEIFGERFCSDDGTRGGFIPNPVQCAVMEAAEITAKPGLMILEAQMGVGKTEAALASAEVFASKSQSSGVFFGLPTQATANGIFPRLAEWLRHIPDKENWSVYLAHGAATLNEEYRTMFHGTARTEEDREDADGLLVHFWMDSPKRGLLSDLVAGTVDQLLLSALKQRHLMLRHLGLCGKVVIVDEVHAYDAYMNQYLFRALQWLAAYNVPVILLSATLPGQLREQLVDAYRNPFARNPFTDRGKQERGSEENWRGSHAYPQITWTDGGQVRTKAIPLDAPKRTVFLEKLEDTEIAGYLRCSLSDGGCAGVIVNTVKRAQTLWEELCAAFPEYRVILLHARFLAPDRAALESELMGWLGKRSTEADRNRLIVVGTQVLEQSLDIDFDLLLTDLCPMDLLLQRIGRLHRHDRKRPTALQQARCMVLHAGDELEEGAKTIYGDWLLERTKALLPEMVTLPDSIPELVQAVYVEPEPELLASPVLLEAWEKHQEKRRDMESRAKTYRLKLPKGKMKGLLDDIKDVDDERQGEAAVRDGEPALSVIVMVQYEETLCGFVPWRQYGRTDGKGDNSVAETEWFTTTHVPDEASCVCIAREQLRLSATFNRSWMMDCAIAELKQRTENLLGEWQQSPLLRGELFLILDRNLETTLCGWRLRYDQYRGLLEEKCDGEEGV